MTTVTESDKGAAGPFSFAPRKSYDAGRRTTTTGEPA